MGKAIKHRAPRRPKKKATKATTDDSDTDQPITLEKIQQLKAINQELYGQPKRTRKAYDGYLKRGADILAEIVAERRRGEAAGKVQDNPDWDTDLLEKAFDSTGPNIHSADALEMCITTKCFSERDPKGISTADGFKGAFADYWDKLDGQKYCCEYSVDEETGQVRGNPARAPNIAAIVKLVKHRDGEKGAAATRQHAEALSIEDLSAMMQWSEAEHPMFSAQSQAEPQSHAVTLKHAMMRAFLTSGFTVWTRNFELCKLQKEDVTMNQHGPAPFYHPYIRIHLSNRKGWQKQQGFDGALKNNTYHIYKQDIYEMDMRTHLSRWIEILEGELGRPLEPDDYIFPYIGPNGVVNPKQEMTHDFVQGLLNEFTKGAKIDKYFTTHCLRRGGAQYRLMYAPIGKRWPLSRIRWWGGWAEGENVDTLIRYLVDSLQSFEDGHADALCPTAVDTSTSFLGESDLLKPITKAAPVVTRSMHERLTVVSQT